MAMDNIVEQPVARVKGDPLLKLPEDLYIPPDALEVFLDTFEGPLDLLLYLIRRQNFDILNIPIAHITTQYISYIEMMDELRLELAAEYLLMAALLAEIKSRMLLPRQSEPEDEYDDPRVYLIKKLQEYECIKKAAEEIESLPRYQRDIFDTIIDVSDIEITKQHPEVDLQELLFALQDVLKRVEQLSHHHITKEPLSVRERMAAILEKLNRSDSLAFSALFTRSEGKGGVVVSFLAILELSKEGLLEIIQPEALAELRIRAKKTA
ncbi:MAG: segregation/condensation protein A [Methylococcales symbiont of Hymedesmia sp. n. MRB-2018]|nr:MAG: segregation/condensation protein A [Methylococcales symbiont of Hymedesmia sp. n. MRB-2018]KAF3983864.1 MAG: segregation/condensation protein A [Methylococcales symbiont of Hymedesmia sp. n. MRB-2018]